MSDQTPGQQLMTQMEANEALSLRVGADLAKAFNLRIASAGHPDTTTYHTDAGPKSARGLARLAARILAEEY